MQIVKGSLDEPLELPQESAKDMIRAEVREMYRRTGKEPPLPPIPDLLPQTDTKGLTPLELLELTEFRKKAAALPPIEDMRTFLEKPLVKPKELITGILHQGSKMSLAGGSKSFKTWLLLDLGMSVASGSPWLGFPTTSAPVLFCNFEIQPEFLQERMKAIQNAKGTGLEAGVELWNLRGYAAPYNLIIPLILERIKEKQYGLIILDPIYKLYGDTDENAAGDVAALMNAIESLAVKSQAAVVFGAHYSKGNQAGKESIDRVSGSGVFARDPDSLIAITQHEEEEAFVVEPKLRNLPPVEPFVVKWGFPLMVRDEALNPRKLRTGITKGREFNEDQLIASLVEKAMTSSEWKAAVIKETGMSKASFNRLLVTVKETPGLNFDPVTKRYSYLNPENAGLEKLVSQVSQVSNGGSETMRPNSEVGLTTKQMRP